MFTAVKRVEQLDAFAGRVIAYELKGPYFNKKVDTSLNYYRIDPESTIRYGYVSPYRSVFSGGSGYVLDRFRYPETPPYICALTDTLFKESGPLFARLADIDEIRLLKTEVEEERVKLEYIVCNMPNGRERVVRLLAKVIMAQNGGAVATP